MLAAGASLPDAKRLPELCRSIGRQPVMMFSRAAVAAPESGQACTRRIEQAAGAGILTCLRWEALRPGQRDACIEVKELSAPQRLVSATMSFRERI